MKLPTVQLPPFSHYFTSLGPNILLNTLFSNTLSLYSPLNVRDKVSHPNKTTGRSMGLLSTAHSQIAQRWRGAGRGRIDWGCERYSGSAGGLGVTGSVSKEVLESVY
jgi:hypothetical protein